MRIYRVRTVEGDERQIAADRVIADATTTCFEVRGTGRWEKVLGLPSGRIESVARRVTEVDGRGTWVRTEPTRVLGSPAVTGAPLGEDPRSGAETVVDDRFRGVEGGDDEVWGTARASD
jgi:hypothetical protein